jgi:polyphosphate kinase
MLPASRLTDRELSWLSFNERVLDLAADPSVPLLERVRFMAIFSSNLDEFYMVRVASVLSNLEDGSPMTASPDIEPSELMKAISARTHQLVSRQSRILKDEILPELKKHDIEIVEWDDLDSEARKFVSKIFSDRIFPVLTPLAVDPSHPFPYISGLSLNLAVIVKNPSSGAVFFARVKVPPILNRLIPIGPGKRFTCRNSFLV